MLFHRMLARALVLLASLAMTQPAVAEEDEAERLERANARALQAYRRTDVRKARSVLAKAVREARRTGNRGALLAEAYANLGIVLAEGVHNHTRAVRAFRRALAEDPRIVPDVSLRTEAVLRAFADAGGRHLVLATLDADTSVAVDTTDVPAKEDAMDQHKVPMPSEVAALQWLKAEPSLPETEAEPTLESEDEDENARQELIQRHSTEHEHPRWFVEAGLGVGFSALRRGQVPDRLPESATVSEMSEGLEATARERSEYEGHVPYENTAAHVERALREEGWDCNAVQKNEEVRASNCRVASPRGISVLDPILDLAFGYHVLPRVALALTALVQRNHGVGPMAGVVLGLRGEYMLTRPVNRGFQLGAIGGFGIGSLQARSRRLSEEAPHAASAGPGSVGMTIALGAKAAYRTHRGLAFGVTPLFNIGLPYVLYDMGVTGGIEVAF